MQRHERSHRHRCTHRYIADRDTDIERHADTDKNTDTDTDQTQTQTHIDTDTDFDTDTDTNTDTLDNFGDVQKESSRWAWMIRYHIPKSIRYLIL